MHYQVKAVDAGRRIVRQRVDAASEAQARQAAQHQGLQVLAVHPAARLQALGWPPARRRAFPLLLFSQELSTLLQAGLPLVTALESLSEKEGDAGTRKVLAALVRALREGKPLSAALAQFPALFPDLYVALVQSSEKTGAIGSGLARYIAWRTRTDLLRQKIVSASVYPALLLVAGSGVLLFLLGYVVPRFAAVFVETGTRLPWLSRAMLFLGRQIHDHAGVLAALAAAAALGAAALWRLPAVRASVGRGIAALPGVRERVFLYQVTRLYRSLGILLQSGIPILPAMAMVRGLVGAALAARLDQAALRVREGQPLSDALVRHGLSTPVALRLLHAGEQAGNLGAMMERTADFYDEEMGRWIEWFVRLFEPLLMVFVGAMIGLVVILMYLPIFELAGSIR